MTTRKALGKGLAALIQDTSLPTAPIENKDRVFTIQIDRVRANHLQPRRYFNPVALSELAASIKEHGLAQPIIVSHDEAAGVYELIAGERRLRACELAGLKEVEAIVRVPASDKKRLELALIENIQREDLNAIELALGYLRLVNEFGITQTDIAKQLGKAKSTISNTLRLLDLPEKVQKAVQIGQLSEGHARALLQVQDHVELIKLFHLTVSQNLSVRDVEDCAHRILGGENLSEHRGTLAPVKKPADIAALEQALQHKLGTKVEIQTRKDPTRGKIVVHFYNLNDFDKIVGILK